MPSRCAASCKISLKSKHKQHTSPPYFKMKYCGLKWHFKGNCSTNLYSEQELIYGHFTATISIKQAE